MKCGNCGSTVNDGDLFCMVCGAKIEYSNNNNSVCPVCGSVVKDGDMFCMECGAEIKSSNNNSICPVCGFAVKDGDMFCAECGAEIKNSNNNNSVCPACGFAVKDGDMFCMKCGARINNPTSGGLICSNCGLPIKGDDLFCEYCGADLKSDLLKTPRQSDYGYNMPQNQAGSQKSDNKKMIIIIISIVAAIAIIIAALLGIYFIKGQKKDDAEVVSSQTTEEENSNEDESIPEEEKKISKIDETVISEIISNNSQYTKYGIYVYNAKNGYEFGYNDNDAFLASAMGQIVILDVLADYTEKNRIDIDSEKLIFNYMPNGKEAPSSKDENGQYLTLKQYIEDVAVYGDNNKSNTLVDYLANIGGKTSGFDVINAFLANNGYSNTEINRKTFINQSLVDTSVTPNITTSREIAKLFIDLMNTKCFGSRNYLNNLFRCCSSKGQPIGLKKYIPYEYTSCNVNAFTAQSTNDVALISDNDTEIVVAILSETDEDKTEYEDNDSRLEVKRQLLEYILKTQFEDVVE